MVSWGDERTAGTTVCNGAVFALDAAVCVAGNVDPKDDWLSEDPARNDVGLEDPISDGTESIYLPV
jgi:hypothetical protein